MIQQPLAKKTKQDILDEYQKLLEQYEELKAVSKAVYGNEGRETINTFREQTKESVSKATVDFKQKASAELGDLSSKLNSAFDALLGRSLSEIDKFNDLQQAIDLSKKTLSLHYNIQVAAETLENLVADYEQKKRMFEAEAQKAREDLESQMTVKKRDWEREQEEYAYNLKLERRKENDLYEEEKAAREKIIAVKEDAARQRDEEFKKLTTEAADFPKRLEKELLAKEKEVAARLNGEFEAHTALMKKDWDAEKRFYELQMENLQQQIKKQDAEIGALKKESEAAGKKAQELAVKVIERGHDAGGRSAEESA